MTVSGTAPDSSDTALGDARWPLIERIAASQHFKASARLREFLFYIADCALRNAPEEATEQQIGLRVFHRVAGYNSSEDSIVRTHARLLRQKLASYFAEDGAAEPIIVEVPKGHYLPVFRPRETAPGDPRPNAGLDTGQGTSRESDREIATKLVRAPLPAEQRDENQPPSADAPSLQGDRRPWQIPALAMLLLLLAGGAGFLGAHLAGQSENAPANSPVERFWKPFLGDDPPLVVFSNALFIGDSKRGLSYAPEGADTRELPPENLVDTYTGIGELSAVYTLTRLFDAHRAHFILKRSRLMTWDEAKVKNLIFIGSTAENTSLGALPSNREFTLIATHEYAGIVNHHPKAGEPAVYSRPEHPLDRDYAILALLPGMQPGEHTLIFSGLNTFGTQAAVEFMCRPETAGELLGQVTGADGQVRPFEALIETTITGGVPVEAHLVTVHLR